MCVTFGDTIIFFRQRLFRQLLCETGLPDFPWSKHTKTGKTYQMTTNYTKIAIKYKKWPQTTPNGHKMYLHFPFKGPQTFPKLGFFGTKVNHLATLVWNRSIQMRSRKKPLPKFDLLHIPFKDN
jgi:hypothetical protein